MSFRLKHLTFSLHKCGVHLVSFALNDTKYLFICSKKEVFLSGKLKMYDVMVNRNNHFKDSILKPYEGRTFKLNHGANCDCIFRN